MIYDCFLFSHEMDLLEMRLNELDSVVDKFVIVESNTTFSGRTKPLWFEENKGRFQRFLPKIIHLAVNDMPQTDDPWMRERHQRNAISRAVRTSNDGDMMIVSDVDEIPRSGCALFSEKFAARKPVTLEMRGYSVYVNAESGTWCHAIAGPIGFFLGTQIDQARMNAANYDLVKDAGWHFSSVGGMRSLVTKFESFSHQEQAIQIFKTEEHIEKCLSMKCRIFGGDCSLPVAIDESFPKFLLENRERFSHLIAKP